MLTRSGVPGRGIQHIDLAVADVQQSLDFYRMLLEPLGLTEYDRAPTYRGTEEVVYLQFGRSFLGVRPAAGGTIQSPPEEHYVDHENEDYYAFFAFDPDGMRVEVVCDRMDMDD